MDILHPERVSYQFLYWPIENSDSYYDSDVCEDIVFNGEFRACLKQFGAWIQDNEHLIDFIDEESERFVDNEQLDPRTFERIPSESPFKTYL
jgi:hypothetical protein